MSRRLAAPALALVLAGAALSRPVLAQDPRPRADAAGIAPDRLAVRR